MLIVFAAACAQDAPPPVPLADQISGAVQAAPEGRRDGATVLGYRRSGALEVLRKGTNDLECVADTPGDDGFSVACYHTSLGPYMQRGRELKAEGVSDRNAARWAEVDAGKLTMPTGPATLYVLSGSSYDPTARTVADAYLRYVVYIPGATPESTGLPLSPPAEGGPWIMFPGTPGAHIMINPPR
jgi:hypothetical protein